MESAESLNAADHANSDIFVVLLDLLRVAQLVQENVNSRERDKAILSSFEISFIASTLMIEIPRRNVL